MTATSLDAYLEDSRRRVDETLDRVMPPADARPAVLHGAMRYSVFSGGKRLRPVLCLAACEAVGGNGDAALLPGAAIELLHTYTLVHDDLPCMDDDDFRRGKPTCHRVYGEANAVLAGDALQTLAFEIAARAPVAPPYEPGRLVVELATAAGSRGVIGGQVEDIAVTGQRPDEETVRFIHLHKTAVLFRAALRMGAMAGGAPADALEALTDYGVNLGLAFQIQDDLLDAVPEGQVPAPAPVELTCLSVWDRATAERRAAELTDAAARALARLPAGRIHRLAALADRLLLRKV